MNKQNIMLIASGGSSWIGGIYYVKNMLYSLVKNEKAMISFNIYLYIDEENLEIFEMFREYRNIYFIVSKRNKYSDLLNKFTNKLLHSSFNSELVKYCAKYKIKYIYPVTNAKYLFLKQKSIHWIPDFQHIHLKHLFTQRELNVRDKIFKLIAKKHSKLILSSNDSYKDYVKLFPQHNSGVYIIPFVSAIDERMITLNNIQQVKEKYKIPSKYFFLPNQFWMHKNHITVFKAINKLVNEQKIDVHIVCTGNTTDFRNKDFYNQLTEYIEQNKLNENVHILGFISRGDQIELMKGATAILQPSLFEGWGTVVEDAKTLNKRIILSDIDVHYEQKNENCYIFPREDYETLAELISKIDSEEYVESKYDKTYIQTMSNEYGKRIYEVLSK